jgi:hypothetical protein
MLPERCLYQASRRMVTSPKVWLNLQPAKCMKVTLYSFYPFIKGLQQLPHAMAWLARFIQYSGLIPLYVNVRGDPAACSLEQALASLNAWHKGHTWWYHPSFSQEYPRVKGRYQHGLCRTRTHSRHMLCQHAPMDGAYFSPLALLLLQTILGERIWGWGYRLHPDTMPTSSNSTGLRH